MTKEFLAQEQSNAAILRLVMEAIGKGDNATVAKYMSEHMVHENPFSGSHKGLAEVNNARKQTFIALGISKVDIKGIFAEGPTQAIALLQVHGTDASGKPWSMPAANLFEIVEGKITSLLPFYYDTGRLREIAATRQAPAAGK